MAAADDFKTLKGQEIATLANIAALSEKIENERTKLAAIRANIAGVALGERLAAERAAAGGVVA